MSKIRINELARQLEVKSREVIEKLQELGIAEKVTHSSSIDDDMAERLRRYYSGEESAARPAHRGNGAGAAVEDSDEAGHEHEGESASRHAHPARAADNARPSTAPLPGSLEGKSSPAPPDVQAEPKDEKQQDEKQQKDEKDREDDEKPRAIPLRPPLLGRGSPIQPPMGPRAPFAPSAPHQAHPPSSGQRAPLSPQPPSTYPLRPAMPRQPEARQPELRQPELRQPELRQPEVKQPEARQVAPTSPLSPAPAHPTPSMPAQASPSAPGRPIPPPARPIPAAPTRPGQVLSGPRQPLPAGLSSEPPQMQARTQSQPGVRPGVPIAPPPRPAAPPSRPIAPAAAGPGMPKPQAPQAGRPLAGQPAARPIVPPRPDLAARLGQQQQRSPMPGHAPPRPAMPSRPQTPRPGQPLYQGPPRPGQPPMQMRGGRPGVPGQGVRPGGGPRPMHPTSRAGLIGPGAPPPPPDQAARRPQQYQNRARPAQGRRKEAEEKVLRPQTRREFAAPPPISRDITISEGITVKELSEKLDVKANFVIKKLVDRGIFATINQTLDAKLATDISREFGASTSTVTYEEEAMQDVQIAEEQKDLFRRPPVVTIMGHVDHGKTSLLDAIRLANVAEKEAGGITQHIGAYHVEKNGQKIVFIDTPGHEAFTRMRARGARVTDIVVLVVAADDGVMPQTIEAIDHARAAKVPIIVAINKIDKADAQVDRIKQQLSDRGLLAEDWGGDTVMVPVSARTKQNLELLLEMILLVAEIQDLKANPTRPAMATVLEAKLDRGRGPVATVLVRNGTLRVGDNFICGTVFGRVRAMIDDRGEQTKEVGPSMPVEVLGLEELPEAGDSFQVVTDTTKAKQIVLYRSEKERAASLAKTGRITLEQFHKRMAAGEVKELPIILKADVGGSAEVLRDTLEKLSNDKVSIRVLRAGVGAINESDVDLAIASNAIIVGFNVRPERNATATAEQEKVDIRLHTIIYEVVDEMKKAMTGLLAPVYKEIYRGRAEIREVFRVSKVGAVAGCLVMDGTISRDSQIRILRDNIVVHTGKIGSLRRFKDDASEVRSGMECGITIENYNDIHQGDVIEAFTMQRVANEAA
jgi:translation initiation factor IF-2